MGSALELRAISHRDHSKRKYLTAPNGHSETKEEREVLRERMVLRILMTCYDCDFQYFLKSDATAVTELATRSHDIPWVTYKRPSRKWHFSVYSRWHQWQRKAGAHG